MEFPRNPSQAQPRRGLTIAPARAKSMTPPWRWRSAAMTSPLFLMPDAPVPAMIAAAALVVKSDRFAAPLDHRLQHLLDLSFGNALDIGSPAGGHVALIERGQHKTHRRNGARVPRFQRLFEPFGEGLTHRRHASPAISYKAYL